MPRPFKANELAGIFNSLYGNVCSAAIDVDPELKYPKGSGRVSFVSSLNLKMALFHTYTEVKYGDGNIKIVQVQAYVFDDQMCDMCLVVLAPYFCANIHCLHYYCKNCWASVHSTHTIPADSQVLYKSKRRSSKGIHLLPWSSSGSWLMAVLITWPKQFSDSRSVHHAIILLLLFVFNLANISLAWVRHWLRLGW